VALGLGVDDEEIALMTPAVEHAASGEAANRVAAGVRGRF